jgi:hypothetical protein
MKNHRLLQCITLAMVAATQPSNVLSGCNMKALFIGTYSCLGVFAVLLGLAAVLNVMSAAFSIAWGAVGVLFLAIAAMCLWLVCDCRDEERARHA